MPFKFKSKPTLKHGVKKPALKPKHMPEAVKKPPVVEAPVKEKYKPARTSLYEAMDYTQEFSIFYSGVEYEFYFDCVYEMGVRDFLMSYEYVRGKGAKLIRKFKEMPDVRLFIDSGAFTIFDDPKYNDWTNEQWEERIEEYLEWAKRNKDIIFAIADLDLQAMFGIELITEWRRKFFEPFMLETGIPVCFVWHTCDGNEGWVKLCQRYPYVSVSMTSDKHELADLNHKFIIAEKYGAVVQGMGSTRTSLLPQFPFYSVDSTSWKAGMRYGLLSVWDGKAVRQVKKDDWQVKAFPIIANYLDISIDTDLLMEEQAGNDAVVRETIRANVYPYMKAQEFIRVMHKKIIYWQKAKPNKVIADALPYTFWPTPDWIETSGAWWQDHDPEDRSPYEYARKMNISTSPSLDVNEIKMWVAYMTLFMNWDNPIYVELRNRFFWGGDGSDVRLAELHNTWVNRIAKTDEERVTDLINFFRDNLEGIEAKLLYLGTNFDRIAKEREHYTDDTGYDEEEVTKDKVMTLLGGRNLLPTPKDEGGAPEIDELDDEIFSDLGLTTQRREDGTVIKWARHVPKPKKLYSDKFPKLACDTCFQAQRCPDFKPGHVCAYNKMFQRYDTRNVGDLMEAMQGMVDLNLGRLQRAMVFEVMSGGIITSEVSQLINQNVSLVNALNNLYSNSSSEVLRQTRVVRADGTLMEETSLTNSGGGILAQLMANLNKSEQKEETPENDKVVLDPDIVDVVPDTVQDVAVNDITTLDLGAESRTQGTP